MRSGVSNWNPVGRVLEFGGAGDSGIWEHMTQLMGLRGLSVGGGESQGLGAQKDPRNTDPLGEGPEFWDLALGVHRLGIW